MEAQLSLNFTGKQLRDRGIKQAIDHAEKVHENRGEKAYQFLLSYAKNNKEFMTEDVRNASKGIVPEPPSKRAWGGVVVRAKNSGVIQRIDYRNVTNPKAHATPATLWQTI